MPRFERRQKDFELTGFIGLIRSGTSSGGEDWCMVTVSGFTFFLSALWIPELRLFSEGDHVTLRGEYAGDRIRNGARQPNFEVYELVSAAPALDPSKNGVPRFDKGAVTA